MSLYYSRSCADKFFSIEPDSKYIKTYRVYGYSTLLLYHEGSHRQYVTWMDMAISQWNFIYKSKWQASVGPRAPVHWPLLLATILNIFQHPFYSPNLYEIFSFQPQYGQVFCFPYDMILKFTFMFSAMCLDSI
jgi:hypothetical protein